ncbi:MAG: protein TolR [Moraxella sp.]|nr:protein TolR [Moraxella sp.]
MKRTPYARHKNPLNSDMNVVPYIDVMLVLLIIFMVAAPMLTTGVEVDLPRERTSTLSTQDSLPVIISMKADGTLFISYEGVMDEAVDEAALQERLSTLATDSQDTAGNITLQVLINADASNSYSNIMRLMASLQQLGITKIGLLADSAKSAP